MSSLREVECEACSAESAPMDEDDRLRYLPEIPEWSVRSVDGIERLERGFAVSSYPAAVDFTRRVAEMAEAAGHHPAILLEWGRVTISWWTHAIGGLHLNDFILASRTDALYSGS
ncbi:4a-hydroxytetrahydrobiopterin dehydratase [soil metagenome]